MKTLRHKITLVSLTVSMLVGTITAGYAQILETLINDAIANNPTIQRYELEYQLATEKTNEVNALPNTEFSVGYFVSEPETRTGPQRFRVSARQMMPWFGSISAKAGYNSAIAEAQLVDVEIARRKLIAAISNSYYTLYSIKAKQGVVNEIQDLLNTYETTALKAVEAGTGSAVDILRLQMRKNAVEEMHAVLSEQFRAELAQMNTLLNRPLNTSIVLPDQLEIPERDYQFDSQQLQIHPELVKFDKLYASIDELEDVNTLDRKPMLGIGLDYIAVAERQDVSFSDNGKDVVMPMVSVSIPIFNRQFTSKTRQNSIKQEGLKAGKLQRELELVAKLEQAVANRNAARIKRNTQLENMEQASDATTLLLNRYQTGNVDFNELLEVLELQLSFEMNAIDATLDYYLQTTRINYLVH